MVQSIKHLLHRHGTPSLFSEPKYKKLGVVAYICNPSTGKV